MCVCVCAGGGRSILLGAQKKPSGKSDGHSWAKEVKEQILWKSGKIQFQTEKTVSAKALRSELGEAEEQEGGLFH